MRHPLIVWSVASLALSAGLACTKLQKLVTKKEGADPVVQPPPPKPVDETPISTQRSELGVVTINVELRPDGLLLGLAGVPAGALLECDLDAKPLVPCHDGALFSRPEPCDHRINLIALVNGEKVAFGASPTFTVEPQVVAPEGDSQNPLLLQSADPHFENGQVVPMSADFVAHFQFADEGSALSLGCEPTFKCSYDSRTSPFWTACDASGPSFTISKDLLALGLQYLSVQAHCEEHIGPILTLFFYGVPDGYQPMQLRAITDGEGRHVVSLVKADDCPESQQSFECSEAADDPFASCVGGNVVDQPKKGFRIRLSCDHRPGPPLDLNP